MSTSLARCVIAAALLGPTGPVAAATVELVCPADGAEVGPRTAIGIELEDGAPDVVTLRVDDVEVASATAAPWALVTPPLREGTYAIEVVATFPGEPAARATAEIEVTSAPEVGAPCQGRSDCASGLCAQDEDGQRFCTRPCDGVDLCPEGFWCVAAIDGTDVCVPDGSGDKGLFGARCEGHEDCASGLCATDDGEKRCTQRCSVGADAATCPAPTTCVELPDDPCTGLCGGHVDPPSRDGDGGGGGCAAGGGAGGMLAALGVLAALIARRRR
jgi:uncharacterized protein (TIGR03382 family)